MTTATLTLSYGHSPSIHGKKKYSYRFIVVITRKVAFTNPALETLLTILTMKKKVAL